MDTTHLTRSANHVTGHLYVYQWIVAGLVTSVEDEKIKFQVNAWPNPTPGNLTISFELQKPTEVEVRVLDENGKVLSKSIDKNFSPGRHDIDYTIDKRGVFFVVMIFDGTPVTTKIVRE